MKPPSARRIYRVGSMVFRVWVERPDAGAELLKGSEWVWTPIPSGSIATHPRAEELTEADVDGLSHADEPVDPPSTPTDQPTTDR